MRKSNIALIVGVIAVVAGLVISVVGFSVAGGLYGMYFDRNGFHFEKQIGYSSASGWSLMPDSDDYTGQYGYSNTDKMGDAFSEMAEDFTSVDIGVVAADVQIIPSDENKVEYQFSKWEEVKEFGVKNNTLVLKTETRPMISFFGSFSGKSYVKVYCKNAAEMKTIDISTVSGGIELSGFLADRARFSTVSGGIDIGSLTTSGDIELNTTSGSIDGEKIQAEYIGANTVSGEIDMSETITSGGNYSTVSGEISVGGELSGKHNANTVSGSISFDSSLPKSSYRCSVSSISGKGKLNGESIKGTVGSGPNELDANTTSGRIEFNLGE